MVQSHQKLSIILESKLYEKIKSSKMVNNKKGSPRKIFLNDYFF